MTVEMHDYTGPILDREELDRWKGISTTVISDGLGRINGISGAIQTLVPDMPFIGQALTVKPLPRNNTALHYALDKAWLGCVMVVDAGGEMASAVWGGVSIQAAKARGMAAVVVDGCVRDIDLIRAAGVPVYSRGWAPNGPGQDIGGAVNVRITCGGIDIKPGDLIFGDNDGVAAAPIDDLDGLYAKCKERSDQRADYFKRIAEGTVTHDIWNPQCGK